VPDNRIPLLPREDARGASDSPGHAPAGMYCDSGGIHTAGIPGLQPLPVDSVLTSVRRCLFEVQPVAGDGEWMVRIEQLAESGLDGLAPRLRLPPGQGPPHTSCL